MSGQQMSGLLCGGYSAAVKGCLRQTLKCTPACKLDTSWR